MTPFSLVEISRYLVSTSCLSRQAEEYVVEAKCRLATRTVSHIDDNIKMNPYYDASGYNGQNLAVYDCEFSEMLRY
jgi:hypothetical protein